MSSDRVTIVEPSSWHPNDAAGLRYCDVVALVFAAPLMLVIGVPAAGYAIGASTWILARGLGVAVDHLGGSLTGVAEQVSLRLTYRLLRVLLLVGVVVLGLRAFGRSDGTTALLVITVAFTIQLSLAVIHRPGTAGLEGFPAPQPDGDQSEQCRDDGQDHHARLRREERGRERGGSGRLPAG
jgi:hypothetical protein